MKFLFVALFLTAISSMALASAPSYGCREKGGPEFGRQLILTLGDNNTLTLDDGKWEGNYTKSGEDADFVTFTGVGGAKNLGKPRAKSTAKVAQVIVKASAPRGALLLNNEQYDCGMLLKQAN